MAIVYLSITVYNIARQYLIVDININIPNYGNIRLPSNRPLNRIYQIDILGQFIHSRITDSIRDLYHRHEIYVYCNK